MKKSRELQVGDIVYVNLRSAEVVEGEIFGIANKKDLYGDRFAVSYEDNEGHLTNDIFSRDVLEFCARPRNNYYELTSGELIKRLVHYGYDRPVKVLANNKVQNFLVMEDNEDNILFNVDGLNLPIY